MSDLISKQAAIEAMRSYMADNEITDSDWHADWIAYEIKRLPSAQRYMPDLVEVVRCKDCKHRHDDGYCEAWGDSFHHWEDFEKVPEDMFCGYGEREEE